MGKSINEVNQFNAGFLSIIAFILLSVSVLTEASVIFGNVPDPSNPNLMFWLKADSITGLNDGETVAVWADSSAAGRDFIGGLWYDDPINHSPVFRAGILNGLPVVEFDGIVGQWVGFDAEEFNLVGDVTVIAVVADVLTETNSTVSCFANSSNGRHWTALETAAASFVTRHRVSTHYTATAEHPEQIQSGDPLIGVATISHQSESTDVVLNTYSNGFAGLPAWSDADPSFNRLGIGAFVRQHDAGPAAYFDGQIAEVLVYDRVLDEEEINDIGWYLSQKYSIETSYHEPNVVLDGAPNNSHPALLAWLKADAITAVSHGSFIEVWEDSSDKGNDFIGGYWGQSENKPVFKSNGINGKPVVGFTGNQWMMCPSNLAEEPLNDKTIIVVAKDIFNAVTSQTSLGVLAQFTTDDYGFARASLKAGYQQITTHSRMGKDTHSICTVKYDDYAILAVGTFNADGSHYSMANGEHSEEPALSSNSVITNVIALGSHAKQHLRYEQGSYDGYGEHLIGDIAEVLIYDKILNEEEIFQISNYLTRKYFLATDYVLQSGTVEQTGDSTIVYEQNATSGSFYVSLSYSPAQGESVVVQAVPHHRASRIRLNSGLPGQAVQLYFNSTNWNIPQQVVVRAVDDQYQQSKMFDFSQTAIVKFFIQSSSPSFQGTGIKPLRITVVDNNVEHWSMLPLDINEDTYINLADLSDLAMLWLDKYYDFDLYSLINDWLRCTNPQAENCINPLVHISSRGAGRATGYLPQNRIVSIGEKTHIAWQDSEGYWEAPTSENEFFTRVKTYCRQTQSWSPTYTIGKAHDNHGTPVLLTDSLGYIHIIYYPHHQQFRYRRSLLPNDVSQWTDEELIGNSTDRLTYPSAVRTKDDKIILACRYRDLNEFWTLAIYEKEFNQPWSGPRIIARGHGSQGYTNWSPALSVGDDGETIHLSFSFYETDIPDSSYSDISYAVGYLYSPDQGITWKHLNASNAALPVTPYTVDIVAGEPFPVSGIRVENCSVAIAPDDTPWLLYSQLDGGMQYDNIIAKPNPSGGWDKVSLLSIINNKWDNMSLMGGNMTFDKDGNLYIALTLITSPTSSPWGSQLSEVIMLYSEDMAENFKIYRISPWFNDRNDPDPTRFVPSWWPSIERAISNEKVSIPSMLFTHGVRGISNSQILSNDVVWCDLKSLLDK